MSLPTSVVTTGCDSVQILCQALDAARNSRPMGKEQLATILAKTAGAAKGGKFELYRQVTTSTVHIGIRMGWDEGPGRLFTCASFLCLCLICHRA
jgi:hypothetical protein